MISDLFYKQDWSRDVVLAAVKQNGLALQFVPTWLQKDKEIVSLAVEQNKDALDYVSPKLSEWASKLKERVKELG